MARDRLARTHELLRQQRAVTGRALHRADPRFELRRPAEQPLALAAIRAHEQLTDELFVAIDRDSSV